MACTHLASPHGDDRVSPGVLSGDVLRAYLTRSTSLVTYAQAARDLDAININAVTQALEMLMEQDAAAGRPFLAARVVSRINKFPARGFFDKARALGRQIDNETAFHEAELAALGTPDAQP